MSVETGLDWLLSVDVDDTGSGSYTDLPNQKGGGFKFANNTADANHKANAGWEDFTPISKGWSMPVDGFTDCDNLALLFIVDARQLSADIDDLIVYVKLTNKDGDTYTGQAIIENWDNDSPFDGHVTYSCNMKGKGALVLTRAT